MHPQFLELFANKHISSSEDRLEETKRRKLALKCEKVVELMMVSGIPTASGYEERIRFSEMEVVERGADERGLLANTPDAHEINGWDVNIVGVRTTSVRRTVRYHTHAVSLALLLLTSQTTEINRCDDGWDTKLAPSQEFIIRAKEHGKPEIYIGRRYGDFARLQKRLRTELPGKVLPPLPRKNKSSTSSTFLSPSNDDDASSVSSVSTQDTGLDEAGSVRSFMGNRRSPSATRSSRGSSEIPREKVTLYREMQRVSLRAYLRTILQNPQIARTKAITEFLNGNPVTLNEEEWEDIRRRKEMDLKRIEEQKRFYEIARQRAKELDVYMERFRRDIIESSKSVRN